MKHFVVLLCLVAWLAGRRPCARPNCFASRSQRGRHGHHLHGGCSTARTGTLDAAVEQAFEEVRRLDRMLSNYRPDSEWSEVNRFAAQRPVAGHAGDVPAAGGCLEYSRASEGAFDITVGPLMKVWGFYKGSGGCRTRRRSAGRWSRVGYGTSCWIRAAQTVRFARPGSKWTRAGSARATRWTGWSAVLRENGVEFGAGYPRPAAASTRSARRRATQGWKVKIRDPQESQAETVEEFTLKDESMSTSGNYEKFFQAEGKHVQPHHGPADRLSGAGHAVGFGDCARRRSTARPGPSRFSSGPRSGRPEHKPKGFRVFLCEDRAELACAWLQ